MKKFVAIFLSALMFFLFATASSGTQFDFSGNANFYYDAMNSDGSAKDTHFLSEYILYIKAQLNDKFTIRDGLDICDSESGHTVSDLSLWATYDCGAFKFSLTSDDFQAMNGTAILTDPNYYLNSASSVVVDAAFTQNLTLRAAYSPEEFGDFKGCTVTINNVTYGDTQSTNGGYVAALRYATDQWGLGLSTTKTGALDKTGYDATGFLKASCLKAYASLGVAPYNESNNTNPDKILGLGFYPIKNPFSAVFEYNFQNDPLNWGNGYHKNPKAFLVSYQLGQGNLNFERIIHDVQGPFYAGNPVNRSRVWCTINF